MRALSYPIQEITGRLIYAATCDCEMFLSLISLVVSVDVKHRVYLLGSQLYPHARGYLDTHLGTEVPVLSWFTQEPSETFDGCARP